jgi:hypothetical protein
MDGSSDRSILCTGGPLKQADPSTQCSAFVALNKMQLPMLSTQGIAGLPAG